MIDDPKTNSRKYGAFITFFGGLSAFFTYVSRLTHIDWIQHLLLFFSGLSAGLTIVFLVMVVRSKKDGK